MKVYTCENCIKAEIVCEVTVKDDMRPPKNCPYAIMTPDFRAVQKEADA